MAELKNRSDFKAYDTYSPVAFQKNCIHFSITLGTINKSVA